MLDMFYQGTLLLVVGLAFSRAYVADLKSLHVSEAFSRFGPSIEQLESANQELHGLFSQQDYKCTSEGRFEDPDDCGQYYDCIQSNTGELIANKKSCLEQGSDTTIKACAQTKMIKGCSSSPMKSERSFHFSDSTLLKVCKDVKNEFMCSDCKTLVMCVEGVPFRAPCGPGFFCAMNKTKFTGGVCYPDAPSECTCNKDDFFRQDRYNPSKFLSCDKKESEPEMHTCPGGTVFNEERRSCGNRAESTCSIRGSFAMTSDCTNYYTCILTTSGWIQKEFSCTSANTMFNDKTGFCEDPCNWYTGSFTCKKEGRFANPGDCSTFYECINDPLDSGKFIQTQHMCPEGYEWGPMANRSYCVASSTTKEDCVPTKPNDCKIPSEWCSATTDPCAKNNGNCEDVCTRNGNIAVCSCNDGYDLGGDGKTCDKISPSLIWESYDNTWTDAQCAKLSIAEDKSLTDCKLLCETGDSRCTAINYQTVNKKCILRGCDYPIPIPVWNSPLFKGYSIK